MGFDPNDAKREAQAKKEAEASNKMLLTWAQKQAGSILMKMETARAAVTLSIHWPKIRQGWVGGFVSGVNAGFQLGYKTANRLTEPFLEQSEAVLTGTEAEVIEKRNAELREFLGVAIGEASVCWKEIPNSVFDSERALKIVDRLMLKFGIQKPEADPNQLELPIKKEE